MTLEAIGWTLIVAGALLGMGLAVAQLLGVLRATARWQTPLALLALALVLTGVAMVVVRP